MEVMNGSCPFGLWHVHVWWAGTCIIQVRFARSRLAGPAPPEFRQFLSGKRYSFEPFQSGALMPGGAFSGIYRITQGIAYGETMTYGEVAAIAGTHPRMVGRAMAVNPTPLLIPCHRIVAARGLGGFSPSIEIKEALLKMERQTCRKRRIIADHTGVP